ncbi:MAG: hypothetical protein ACE5ER_05685 [Nitrospinaceae bacterium]
MRGSLLRKTGGCLLFPFWAAALVMGLGTGLVQAQTPAQILLNLESLKLDMEVARQGANRLGLLSKEELQEEVVKLQADIKRTRGEFQKELENFRRVAQGQTYEKFGEMVEKFQAVVAKLYDETLSRLDAGLADFPELRLELAKRGAASRGPQGGASAGGGVSGSNREKGGFGRISRGPGVSFPDFPRLQSQKAEADLGGAAESPDPLTSAPTAGEIPTDPAFRLGDRPRRDRPLNRETAADGEVLGNYAVPGRGEAQDDRLAKARWILEKFTRRLRSTQSRLDRGARDAHALWLSLGDTYLELERYLFALPPDLTRRVLRAEWSQALVLSGLHSAALAYRQALGKKPGDPATHHTLGLLYAMLADEPSALNYLEQARRLYLARAQASHAQQVLTLAEALRRKWREPLWCPADPARSCEPRS